MVLGIIVLKRFSPGVKVYTLKVSSDGRTSSDAQKHWVWLNWNIRVNRDSAQLTAAQGMVKARRVKNANALKQLQGGIDLIRVKNVLQTKSEGIKFHLDPAMLRNCKTPLALCR